METGFNPTKGKPTEVRFHLGSGINGNVYLLIQQSYRDGLVRFHLGSGINGNKELLMTTHKGGTVRFHLGSGINGNNTR